ncbi:MAG: hypothetical protein AAGC83_10300, partial [Pseudomonadota bacterium]
MTPSREAGTRQSLQASIIPTRRVLLASMLIAVVSGFLLAIIAPLVAVFAGRLAGWILALLPLGLTAFFAQFISPIAFGATISSGIDWIPALGIRLSFYLDGLSLT